MSYNPSHAISMISDLKGVWTNANNSGDEKKKKEAAEKAQAYYQELRDNGYEQVANDLQSSSYDVSKYIKEKYTAPLETQIKQNAQSLYDSQENDKQMMADKFTKVEDYNYNHNPYESEIGKSIMKSYKLQGDTAAGNEVANSASSNSGNIDSYAAANAKRQQLAFTNAGNQAILTDFNTRVANAKDIVNNLGVYLQNQDTNMQNTINLQQTEAQRLFDNKVKVAETTGYVPTEWTIKNNDTYNQFLNADGTFKAEMENVDIQALINQAKARGDTKTANELAVVRARKMFGNYSKFGQYINQGDANFMQNQKTKEYDLEEKAITSAEKLAQGENDLAITLADKEKESALAQIEAQKRNATEYSLSDVEKMLKNTKTPSQELIDLYNSLSLDATTYTTENPPPMTGENIEGSNTPIVDDSGDEYPAYTAWNTSGIKLQNHSVKKPDATTHDAKIKESGVDEYGKKAINSVYSAVANGTLDSDKDGQVTNYELADFLITHSNENDTDKKQLKKVFAYFGLNNYLLDNVEDVGKGTNMKGSDYKYGVEYK